jgi:flavin reductase (DIM6/NTAB) family NADH-FMN oxidoreductase RutF
VARKPGRPLVVSAFDDLVSRLDYPMLVVTTYDGSTRAGCLVGFATQCSIDPARYLVCLSDKNHTHRVAAGADTVAVHLLRERQHDVAALFGGETGDEVDKFARCAWSDGPGGVPVLDDCAGWFAGRILQRHVVGDHTALLLEPYAGSAPGDGTALLRFEHVRDLDPGHDA